MGHFNTADGVQALYSNTSGRYNTATGVQALHDNTSGEANTAIGAFALSNANAVENTATGYDALGVQHNRKPQYGYGVLTL